MNILFLTIGRMESIEAHSIYPDLLRQFRNRGHQVYVVSPREKRARMATELVEDHGAQILYVRIGNITKCNTIEKGISTILIEAQYKAAIRKYFSDVNFDLILYSTPPITLAGVVEFIKKRDNAKSYLLLKDIFPQNAVDVGMMRTNGLKGLLYKYFRSKEKKLYAISDRIGCMSQANMDYILQHNPEVSVDKVEVCPNSIEVRDMSLTREERIAVRDKYGIAQDKKVFVYGGNLGKPQGVPFIIECLKSQERNSEAYFLIVGNGTEYGKLEAYFNAVKPQNMKLMKYLPKDDYDSMIAACDVGMIFLDHRFTIPNFPSRLLAYMQARLPVLALTDTISDIGKVIVNGDFGWWGESDDVDNFATCVTEALKLDTRSKGKNAFDYLLRNYSAAKSSENIEKLFY